MRKKSELFYLIFNSVLKGTIHNQLQKTNALKPYVPLSIFFTQFMMSDGDWPLRRHHEAGILKRKKVMIFTHARNHLKTITGSISFKRFMSELESNVVGLVHLLKRHTRVCLSGKDVHVNALTPW